MLSIILVIVVEQFAYQLRLIVISRIVIGFCLYLQFIHGPIIYIVGIFNFIEQTSKNVLILTKTILLPFFSLTCQKIHKYF